MKKDNTANEPINDEITLFDIFCKIKKNSTLILIITFGFIAICVVYMALTPKIYNAKAFIRIGGYQDKSNSSLIETENFVTTNEIVKELSIIYIDLQKVDAKQQAWIEDINPVKNQKNIFAIKAQGLSRELAIKELKKVIEYVQTKHARILEDIYKIKMSQKEQIEGNIELLKTKTIPALNEKIKRYTENIAVYEENFMNMQKNLKEIKTKNPSLAALQINEQRYLADMIIRLKDSLETFESQKNSIEMVQLSQLNERLNYINFQTQAHSYKNTEVIGDIIAPSDKSSPKSFNTIIAVAFAGLIISILLALLREEIHNYKLKSCKN